MCINFLFHHRRIVIVNANCKIVLILACLRILYKMFRILMLTISFSKNSGDLLFITLHFAVACFRWFCHFDDDNYVNVPRLLKLLDNYNPREDWYLGRPSIPAPLEIIRQGPEPQRRPVSFADQFLFTYISHTFSSV